MPCEDLMASRVGHLDARGQRALVRGGTQSWKERSRSASSSDVIGDIERAFFEHRMPPAALFSNQRPSVHPQRLSTPHLDSPGRQHRPPPGASIKSPSLTPTADSASGRSNSPQGPRKHPSLVSPLQASSPSRFGSSFTPKDLPVLDPSNPAAFFSSSSNRRDGGGRGATGGILSPSVGSGRRENLPVSSPRQHGHASPASPKLPLPHSATVPSITPTSNSKSRFGGFPESPQEPSAAFHPSFSMSEASRTIMAASDSSAPPLPTLGLGDSEVGWPLHPAFTNPNHSVPRTRSTGSLGRFAGLEALRQLEAEGSKPTGHRQVTSHNSNSSLTPKHSGKATFSWYIGPEQPTNQSFSSSATDDSKVDMPTSDIFGRPDSMNLPLQSPRGFVAMSLSSSRRGMQKGGSFQELRSPRPAAGGSAAIVSQILGAAPLLSPRGAAPLLSPIGAVALLSPRGAGKSAAGTVNPSPSHVLPSSDRQGRRSPATVPGATGAVSSRRLVRRSSYGGMEWWRTEQAQMRQSAGGQSTVEDMNSVRVDMSMSDYVGMLNSSCAKHQVPGANEHLPHDARHCASGKLMPRHIFKEESLSFSTDSSPIRGRTRYTRSISSARRVSLEVDVSQNTTFFGTQHDTEVSVKTPCKVSMQQAAAFAATGTPTGTPTRPSNSTPRSEADGLSSPMLRHSGSRRASACASPLGQRGSPATPTREGLSFVRGDVIGGQARSPLPVLTCHGGGVPHQHAEVAEQQPLFMRNLQRVLGAGGTSGAHSGPIAVSKTMSWSEEGVVRQGREMPSNKNDSENLSNPFTWKELEESCRKLDEANIRIAGIDLTDVASTEGDDDKAHANAEVAPEEGAHDDVMLLSPATIATQKCAMPWDLPARGPISGGTGSQMSPSGDSGRPGSPAGSSPRRVLINRVLGKVRRQWEALHGGSRFLSRHGSAHM